MKITLVLFLCTAVCYFAARFVSRHYGPGSADRFLERNVNYTAESLKSWVEHHPKEAAAYACPVLFPLDLLFMSFLAAFLAVASTWLADFIPSLREFIWLFVILPAIYLAVDVSEDTLLSRFLTSPDTITVKMVKIVQTLTHVKVCSVLLAIGQALLLAAGALIWRE